MSDCTRRLYFNIVLNGIKINFIYIISEREFPYKSIVCYDFTTEKLAFLLTVFHRDFELIMSEQTIWEITKRSVKYSIKEYNAVIISSLRND